MKYHIFLGHDEDVESPCEYDGNWKFYSFNSRHTNYKSPENFIRTDNAEINGVNIGIQKKLKVGTAFLVSCYEHSGVAYSLLGEGMQCHWDTTQIAGILIWEESPKNMGAKTYKERQEDARNFLECYNDWVNGNCYHYCLEDEKGELIDSCGGFIGTENIKITIKDGFPEIFMPGVELEVSGDAKWILE